MKRLRWIAKVAALYASRWIAPLSIYRWTGFLPARPVPVESFGPARLAERPVFDEPPSPSVVEGAPWRRSAPGPLVLNHQLEIPGGLVSSLGQVFDAKGYFVPAASHKHREKHGRALVASPYRMRPSIERCEGRVAAVTASNQHFYFHWLLEVLPRLGMLIQQGTPVDRFYLQCSKPFQRDSLRLLGNGIAERVLDATDVPFVEAEKLVVPCFQNPQGRHFPRWMLEFLRGSFLAAADDRPVGPKHLYISRRDAGHRRVANEPELLEKLRERGFVDVRLADLPFLDQVALFKNAEVVVAPHGGGLANLVFSSPGTRLVELFPGRTKDSYYRFSTALGVEHSFVPDRNGDPNVWLKDDYEIRASDLEHALDRVGAR